MQLTQHQKDLIIEALRAQASALTTSTKGTARVRATESRELAYDIQTADGVVELPAR